MVNVHVCLADAVPTCKGLLADLSRTFDRGPDCVTVMRGDLNLDFEVCDRVYFGSGSSTGNPGELARAVGDIFSGFNAIVQNDFTHVTVCQGVIQSAVLIDGFIVQVPRSRLSMCNVESPVHGAGGFHEHTLSDHIPVKLIINAVASAQGRASISRW